MSESHDTAEVFSFSLLSLLTVRLGSLGLFF